MSFVSVDPATGERIAVYDAMSDATLRDAVAGTQKAFVRWREVPMKERAACMRRAAERLRAEAASHAKLMAREMGKPVKDGVAEVNKCAGAFDYYAEHGGQYLARERVMTEARASWIDYEPLGLVLAIMPWNFPFWQVVRFAAPALMAGNGALLKHAANVPGCAIAIERVFSGAGFPNDLFRTLLIEHDAVNALIADPRVKAVTLTGSEAAGRAVAARAGALLKKTVLELGGSDPYLVLADADLELAATICTRARLVNNGQSCIAGKRFIVVEQVREEFERRFVDKMKAAKSGSPLDEKTEIGPMARKDLRDALHAQVTASVEKGAKLLLGGTVPSGPGAFYPATVLTGVAKGMPAFDEEIFGPVAAVVPVRDEDAAVAAANDSNFGLGGAVITRDTNRAERIAAKLECGMVFINDNVRSDARLPFGGVKASGYGRELGALGIKEFVNAKSVYLA